MPSMKLISKRREGSRVTKRYDKAQTPFQRVMASPHIGRVRKQKLRMQYESLNPAELKRSIERLQDRLYKTRNQIERSPAQAKRLDALAAARSNGAWVRGL
jgi:hypothetical protein